MASSASLSAEEATLDRIGGALWGLYIGDALAMPTHWFYGGQRQVQSTYGGKITGFVKPATELQGSIMNLSSTGGGGRGSDSGEIIGKVINHGKKKYWTARGSYHYHCTLEAGENTLEAQLVRLVCRSITDNAGQFTQADLRKKYIDFMTTPGTHNDCYASTCHRMFFANMQQGVAPEKCPDNDGHNVDTIDGIAMTVPVMLATALKMPLQEVQQQSGFCADVTRNSAPLHKYVGNYADLMCQLLGGRTLPEVLAKYSSDFEHGLLANANCGGENVHRGIVLGALLGAQLGEAAIPEPLKSGLKDSAAIKEEIDAFKAAISKADSAI